MLNIKLPWPPTVNTYYTVARGRKILSKRGREFKKACAVELVWQARCKPFPGKVEVLIEAYPPDLRKRDLDNLVKPIFDALQDHGLFDDSQIDDFRVRRKAVEKPGHVRVYISELTR